MFDDMTKRLEEIMRIVAEELKLIRTGRAKPDMVEHVMVDAYGSQMKLVELAAITAPDTQLLVIKPWDKGTLGPIEKALRMDKMSFSPVVDGDMIRIAIPALTGERREEMVKLTHQKIESGKNMMRDARNKTKKEIDEQKGVSGVSEDDIKAWLDEMQKKFEAFVLKLEAMGEDKEKQLREI